MNLNAVDLNLLVAFDALMEHRHVTRAGEAIGLSQPAMSNALSRLRGLFDDELLVRAKGDMAPTPRALELHVPVRRALRQIEEMMDGDGEFQPGAADRTFRLAVAEDVALYLIPKLYGELAEQAPGISLDVQSTGNISGVDHIDHGNCDIAIGRFPANLPGHMRRQPLFDQKFVCMARRGHPAFRGKLTLEKYLAYPHVHFKPATRPTSFIDDYLEARGLHRNIAVSVSLFQVAPALLPDTNLIANLPEQLAKAVTPNMDVVFRDLPFDAGTISTSAAWHQR